MEKIRVLREKANLTQQQLAEKVGVSRIAVVLWEQGKNTPLSKYIKPLADALGVKPADILP